MCLHFHILIYRLTDRASKLISNSFWASTANSMGNLFNTSLLKPFTMRAMAFSVSMPRWLQ